MEEVVANYSAANSPLDTQWMDIDYMEAYKDFTIDSGTYFNFSSHFYSPLTQTPYHALPISL